MAQKPETGANRRDFLKFAATAAPAAAAVAVTAGTPAADAAEVAGPTGDTRLQDTAHTRAYYDSLRF